MAASAPKLAGGFPTPGPQNPTSADVTNHVFFLNHAQWKDAREVEQYDHVVIGTGFCALGFAHRALEINPKARILMVERGEYFLPEHFQNLPVPFTGTLGGMSETFPWSVTKDTNQPDPNTPGRYITWQHGMVPFFGGRSILWSAWCPRPTDNEMDGWPEVTRKAAKDHFASAEKLLCVQSVDTLSSERLMPAHPTVYGKLQRVVQTLLANNIRKMRGVYRTEAAPIACASGRPAAIDFAKFSTPGPLLELSLRAKRNGGVLSIVTGCTVERILQQGGDATALQTNRGVLPVGKSNVVVAVGTLPAATLARNSFPERADHIGRRFTAHFITAVVGRVPRAILEDPKDPFQDLEIGACYIAGVAKGNYKQQFHIQLSVLSDKKPNAFESLALRYMPDVVATATQEQLASSKDHVVFVCAVLGELDFRNRCNTFGPNATDGDITTNSMLHCTENAADLETWDAMDTATFDMFEQVIAQGKPGVVEYWDDVSKWTTTQPPVHRRRVNATVHEGSTTHIGDDDAAPVDLNYKLKGSSNVYITGAGLWPQSGSWNPTMTMVALAQDLADKLQSAAS